ncbi:serine protease [Chryseobacterium sp. WX]|uniref:S1 family peptidase n=1 Tax=Chryseobacterium sp. WX TaxID=3031803 RepID=UPI0024098604|nr:serine protease [Chryseobacterium sp. WX]WFB69112.1 serine protease [Chryseobacterium sp. WX]
MTNKYLLLLILCFISNNTYGQKDKKDSIKDKTIESNLRREVQQKLTEFNFTQEQLNQLNYKVIESPLERFGLVKAVKELSLYSLIVSDTEKDNSKPKYNQKRLTGPSQYDSRIELLQLREEENWEKQILENAESVGMLVEIEKLTQISKDFYELDVSQSLASRYQLCASEPFGHQSVVGTGTVFIFTEKSVLTALHVLERPLKHYAIVFGFRVVSKSNAEEIIINKDDIYYPQSVANKNTDIDLVEIKVDRNFNRRILEWEKSDANRKDSDEIYMLGHPLGLPMKLAINANIIENKDPFYFYTSLDSFQGNSGSPVFNLKTNKIIGILVSGEVDFKFNGSCNYSPLCAYPYCKGEKVIKIERFVE